MNLALGTWACFWPGFSLLTPFWHLFGLFFEVTHMKAKLFLVTQGKFSERVIARGVNDAKKSVRSAAMGARKAKFIEHVNVLGTPLYHEAFSVDHPEVRIPYCTLSNVLYAKLT